MDESRDVLADTARQLRALVRGVPALSHQERRLARRIEGAAVALEALAEPRPETSVSETRRDGQATTKAGPSRFYS